MGSFIKLLHKVLWYQGKRTYFCLTITEKIIFFSEKKLEGTREDYRKNVNYWPKCIHYLYGTLKTQSNYYTKNRKSGKYVLHYYKKQKQELQQEIEMKQNYSTNLYFYKIVWGDWNRKTNKESALWLIFFDLQINN